MNSQACGRCIWIANYARLLLPSCTYYVIVRFYCCLCCNPVCRWGPGVWRGVGVHFSTVAVRLRDERTTAVGGLWLPSAPYFRETDYGTNFAHLCIIFAQLGMMLPWHLTDSVTLCLQKLCKEDDSLETMLETVIVLRQTLETATDAPPAVETEPTLPPPETLAAQFNHRYGPWMIQDDLDQDFFCLHSITNHKEVVFKMTTWYQHDVYTLQLPPQLKLNFLQMMY